MCYSARIIADYRRYARDYGAELSLRDFVDLFWQRRESGKLKVPKAMEAAFSQPASTLEHDIHKLIVEHAASEQTRLEQELFRQRKRLADAERSLQGKPTKSAAESQRIATEKVQWLLGKLSDLRRTELTDEDSRIFPGYYAPVIVVENGRRIVKPMRYQCRLAGKPAYYDAKFPGTYNARRDSLGGFWKGIFGYSHGLMVIDGFYEHVNRRSKSGGADENVILEFRPRPPREMLVACLWSRWSAPGQPDLLSFAAITDEPPPEIAAAGHDRCVIPIKVEHIDAWLNPQGNLKAIHAILDDRPQAYYEHRLAA